MSVELFEHNKQTYQNIITMFEDRNRVGVVQPTGTGKSFLYLKWIEDHPQDSFVILSPSTEIFSQLQEYAEASDNPSLLDSVQMISYQSLLKMTDEEVQAIHPDKMVLDEFHRTGADLWGPALQRLLEANPNSKVLGASATPVRYLDNSKDMSSELFDRNLAVEMTLGEAVQRKILPPPQYVPVWYDIDGKMENYERDVAGISNSQKRTEMEEKLHQLKRHLEASYGAEDIFKKHMPHDHGKFIVFCRNQDHLSEMMQTMPKWLAGVNTNVHSYVSINVQKDKDEQLQAFKDDKSEYAVKLLFTIDRLNEGLHVKGIDGVVMLRPTTSPIIYLQQMGRALSVGNKNPLIFDMVNNYQNVQITLQDGSFVNVFENEFRDAMEQSGDTTTFQIFEDMREFSSLFSDLEFKLHLSHEAKWKICFSEAQKYREEHGDLNVPVYFETASGYNLGFWISNQRMLFKNGILDPERYKKLTSIGMVWDPHDAYWNRMYSIASEYFKEHGNLKVPDDYETVSGDKLVQWVRSQRKMYKKGKLSLERVEALESLGMTWDPYEAYWNHMYSIASEYFKEHGNLNVSVNYETVSGDKLGNWISSQRKLFKNGILDPERYKKLASIGMAWDALEARWDCMYSIASEYFKEHGNLDVPIRFETNSGDKLGSWVFNQRSAFKRGVLADEKRIKLENIGINWNPSIGFIDRATFDSNWDDNFNLLKKFIAEYHRFPKKREEFEGVKLGCWCNTQKVRSQLENYPKERIQRLQEIGFFNDKKLSLADQISGAQSRVIHSIEHGGKTGPDGPAGR